MTRRLRVALAFAAVLAASGCGGSAGGSDTPKPEQPAAPAADTTPEPGGGGGGDETKPGTELSVGDTAQVTISSFSSEHPPQYPLDSTVLMIEEGSISTDFDGIDLEPEQMDSTPYYVTVRVEATGKPIPTEDNNPDIGFDAVDDRGQEHGSVTFFGSFPRCEDKTIPKTLEDGDSYESCFVYLVPGGGSIDQVNWTGSTDYLSDPVVWK